MRRSAIISEDQRYRYSLTREWSDAPYCIFAMLNPSTADADKDDHTLRRVIRFAQAWGYGGVIVVNLFAVRSSDPKTIRTEDDPVGPENRDYWKQALETTCERGNDPATAHLYVPTMVCAWGNDGGYRQQDRTALDWVKAWGNANTVALGKTAKGFPKHPRPVKKDTKPKKYTGRRT